MKGCFFCEIVAGRLAAEKVYEDEVCIAFRDIHPQAPEHILVIPREHVASLNDIDSMPEGVPGTLLKAVRRIARQLSLDRRGYRVVVNTGPDGGQTVFHLHFHLLGGRPMHWPPG